MRSVCLRLLIFSAIVLLGPVQCLAGLSVSRLSSLTSAHQSQQIHTRDEVPNEAVDLDKEAHREYQQVAEQLTISSTGRELESDIDFAIPPPIRLFHRQVSPSSSDDHF